MPASIIIDLNKRFPDGRFTGGRGVVTDATISRARYERATSVAAPEGDGWINYHPGRCSEYQGPSVHWFREFLDVVVDEAILVEHHDTGDEDAEQPVWGEHWPSSHSLWKPDRPSNRHRWSREPGCEPPRRWKPLPSVPVSNFDRWRNA